MIRLRRKLLLILGPLVILMVAVAAAAIWLLGQVLAEMGHINTVAAAAVTQAHDLDAAISEIQLDLYELQSGRQRHLDDLIDEVDRMRATTRRLGEHYLMREEAEGGPAFRHFRQLLPVFEHHVGALATTLDANLIGLHNQQAIDVSVQLRRDIVQVSGLVRAHAQREQLQLTGRFRGLVLGLTVGFLALIGIAIAVLVRGAGMVLRPVGRLVEASRQLARERFDYRVKLSQKDEFDELAQAYNRLGEQLAANEQRKVEVLRQVALALNHELNNAVEIIELQLGLLDRQAGGNAAFEKCLRQIRQSLQRMTHAVETLRQARRIVLTDYLPGAGAATDEASASGIPAKMLDLERSAAAPTGPPSAPDKSGPGSAGT